MMNRADGTGITSGLAEIANEMEELNSQIDTAEEPVEIMNALRGKQASVDEYRTELAEMVGSKDAKQTPESVLTLIQPLLTAMEATQQSVPQSGIAQAPMQNVVYRSTGSPPGGEQAGSAGFFTESDIPVFPARSRQSPMELVTMFQNMLPKPKSYQEYYDIYSQASPQPKTSAYDALGYQSLINLGSTIANAPKGQLLSTVLDPQNVQTVSDPLLKMVLGKAQEEKARKASIAKSATEAKLKADEAYQQGKSGILKSAIPKIIEDLRPDEQVLGNEKIGYYVYDKKTGAKRVLVAGLGNASEKERAFERYLGLQQKLKTAEFGSEEYKDIKQQIGLVSDIINPRGQFESILSKSVQKYSDELSKKKPDLDPDTKQELVNKYEKKIIDQWLNSQTTEQQMFDPNQALNKNMAEELSALRKQIADDMKLSNNLKSLSGQALLGGEVFQTGTLAETRLNFAKLLQLVPGGQEAFNSWARSKGVDTKALNTILNPDTNLDIQVGAGELVKRAGASFAVYMADNFPGNLNQSEVDLIKNAGPQLTTSLQGLKVLSHIYTKSAERANNISTFYNDYLRTKEGETIVFGGKEITVSKDPIVMVADIDQGIKDYIISTDMFDKDNNIQDPVLQELVTGLPSEADTNAQLGAMNFISVPQLGNAPAVPEIKLPPEQYGLMLELKKLKPQLTQFIEDYNSANPSKPITIDVNDPTTVTGNNNSDLVRIMNHVLLNLKTPEIDKFLSVANKPLNAPAFGTMLFAEVLQP